MKKVFIALLFTAVLTALFCTTALAGAQDNVPPDLKSAYMTKASFAKGDNVELVLKFIEPGGIDLDGTYLCFSLLDSPTPNSTTVYSGWIGKDIFSFTDATDEYCSAYEKSHGYCAVLASCPVSKDSKDYFMSGSYRLTYLVTQDPSHNYLILGNSNWGGGLTPVPMTVEFNVDNPGADLVGPVVQSIGITPQNVAAGDTIQFQIVAKDNDGIASVDLTFCTNNTQYYVPSQFTIPNVDLNGLTTLTETVTLPDTLPPGKYTLGQFHITDNNGNENYDSSLSPIIQNEDDCYFNFTNSGYNENVPPTIEEFQLSQESAKPGDTVTFKVKLKENGTAIQDDCLLRLMFSSANTSGQAGSAALTKGDDGYFTGTYQIPINWPEQVIRFGLMIYYEDGDTYQPYFPMDGSDLDPKLNILSVFSGLNDTSVLMGSSADLVAGITAGNQLEGDMTSRITVANPPDFSTPGVYFVRYEVRSSQAGAAQSNTYVGYRWIGVTEVLPEDSDDAFVVAEDRLVIDATSNDLSVQVDTSDSGVYKNVGFSSTYTQCGTYKLTKLNYNGASSLTQSTTATQSRQLLCSVVDSIAHDYTLSFKANGATSGTMGNMPMAFGTAKRLPPNAFKRTGYSFLGWAKTPAGPVNYSDKQSVLNLTSVEGSTVALYAQWGINSYTVAFNSQGGTLVTSKKANYNTMVTAPAAPTRSGYTFTGWYKEAACTNAWNFTTDKVTGNITLYAKWLLSAPAGVKAVSDSYSSIMVSWNAAAGVSGYAVYRASSSTGVYTAVGIATSASFTNSALATGTNYCYKVRAYKLSGATKLYGAWSAVVSAKPIPAAPATLTAKQAAYNSINLTWSAVAGATKYALYRSTTKTGEYSLLTATAALTYTNTNVNTGTVYYYKVKAYRVVGGTNVYGGNSPVVSAKTTLAVPASVKAARVSSASISVTWGTVAGATMYEVWHCTSSATGTYSKLAETASLCCANTGLTAGKTYWYKVRAYRLIGAVKVYGYFSAIVYAKP